MLDFFYILLELLIVLEWNSTETFIDNNSFIHSFIHIHITYHIFSCKDTESNRIEVYM
jgi:hypothetical protein